MGRLRWTSSRFYLGRLRADWAWGLGLGVLTPLSPKPQAPSPRCNLKAVTTVGYGMQNAAQAPSTPQITIQTTPSGDVQFVTQQQPMRPLTSREISAIRSRRSDISSQLTSSMERREGLIGELEDAPPAAAPGLIAQIQVLDQRIIKIEQDMEASGQMLRTGLTVDNGTSLVGPREFGNGRGAEEAAARGAAMGAMILVPIFLVYMVARLTRARRRRNSPVQAEQDSRQEARMERLEQAVDAIALEIERVGESQRYQTKVLAEANLMPAMSTARSAEPARARDYDR
jgi:hypothetical protein